MNLACENVLDGMKNFTGRRGNVSRINQITRRAF